MKSRFDILEILSESTTTIVYKAFDTLLNRKVLQKNYARDDNIKTRVEREARALAAIHSENIVHVYELTEVDECTAIVMEYVDGKSLEEVLREQKKLSWESVKRIAIDILKALSEVHQHGIIHRDIKPANIILAKDRKAKLTDFGLAAVSTMPTITIDGSILGTPAYMSPEQARGDKCDFRTDFFSLGLTLLEAYKGSRVCGSNNYLECLKMIINFKETDVRDLIADIPQEIASIFEKFLAPLPNNRYQDAKEALRALGVIGFNNYQTIHPKRTRWLIFSVIAIVFVFITVVLIKIDLNKSPKQNNVLPYYEFKSNKDSGKVTIKEDKHPMPVANEKTNQLKEVQNEKNLNAGFNVEKIELSKTIAESVDVFIQCKPWRKFFINNEYVEETPLPKPIRLFSGTYEITIQHPHFVPVVKKWF